MTDNSIKISVTVNGQHHELEITPFETLLELLRNRLDLTGTKKCCGEGECGACTVILNGRGVNSCIILAAEADGSEVLTIEGLGEGGKPSALQQAFLDKGAVQCGFCTPGMIMAAHYLLMSNPHPTEEEIREGLSGNLCRCTGYGKIVEAVRAAAEAAGKAAEDER
ncbi:MAG: (2Fe-2S)-binding protein [Spirochaetaceae bacterium]|nr:MAG: (2Fe-2S)-binding protein [Spirochaetaceae bacterium]